MPEISASSGLLSVVDFNDSSFFGSGELALSGDSVSIEVSETNVRLDPTFHADRKLIHYARWVSQNQEAFSFYWSRWPEGRNEMLRREMRIEPLSSERLSFQFERELSPTHADMDLWTAYEQLPDAIIVSEAEPLTFQAPESFTPTGPSPK